MKTKPHNIAQPGYIIKKRESDEYYEASGGIDADPVFTEDALDAAVYTRKSGVVKAAKSMQNRHGIRLTIIVVGWD